MKFYCIGLPRTGTFSLFKLFKEAGYKSKHYLNPSKLNYKVFEDYDFIGDTPVNIFYKDIPNSKNSYFINTTRDLESWLQSCEVHFKNERIDIYRYSLFNSFTYDRERFTKTYLEHKKNVEEFSKINNFLEIDFTKEDALEIREKLAVFTKNSKFKNLDIKKYNSTNQNLKYKKSFRFRIKKIFYFFWSK